MGPDLQDGHADRTQRHLEVVAQRVAADALTSDLHVVHEQPDQRVEVPAVHRDGVARRQHPDVVVRDHGTQVRRVDGVVPWCVGSHVSPAARATTARR